jgi:beta-galactosidase
VYLDGKLAGQSKAPLKEDRGLIIPVDQAHPNAVANDAEQPRTDGYRHTFALSGVDAGKHRLDILATALGMIKGDWQIDSSMNFERKGIWDGVLLDGQPLAGWEMIPYLAGEKAGMVERPEAAKWSQMEDAHELCWYTTRFKLSAAELTEDADYRLDAAGLGKGMLFLNEKGVGRHWLVVSPGTGGKPTQQYYHLPNDWLRAENTLMIFEEQAVLPAQVRIERRMMSRAG